MWLPVVIAKLLSLAIDLAKKSKTKQTKHLGMTSIFLFINGGYIYIYNATDACMTKGNEYALAFIKLLLDLLYSYKHYTKITQSFAEPILNASHYFLTF